MRIAETLFLYGLIGFVVMLVMASREKKRSWFRVVHISLWWSLWPFFVVLLLSSASAEEIENPRLVLPENTERIDPRLERAEQHLLGALYQLEGVAEEILKPEIERVKALTSTLNQVEKRLKDMGDLLRTPSFDKQAVEENKKLLQAEGCNGEDTRVQSLNARLRNIETLQRMEARTKESLERALLKMEELSGHIQVLRFAARPDTEVIAVIKDIAVSVESAMEGFLHNGAIPEPLKELSDSEDGPVPTSVRRI